MNEAAIRNAREFQAEEGRLKQAGRWSDLVDLYRARAERVDPAGRERLLFKAGEVAADRLGDPGRAERLFLDSFRVRSSFLPAIGALKVLHAKAKNHAGLLEVIDLELDVTTDRRRQGQLLFEKGGLLADREPEAALEAYAASIRAYPKSRAPLDPLEALARKLKRWEPLVEAYRELAIAAKPEQAAVYWFLGGVVLDEQLRDAEGAATSFSTSLDSGAREPRILNVIARFYERVGDWEGLAKALWRHLEVAKDPTERGKLLKRQAWVHERHLGQPERAQRLLLKAVEATPQDAGAIKSLFKVSQLLDDVRGMATALEAEGALASLPPEERAERWRRAAELRDRSREGKLAYRDVRRALELSPKDPKALKLLDVVTRKLGRWKEHADVLARELALLRPERSPKERQAATALLLRRAEVLRRRLDDPAGARAALRQAVGIDPGASGAWEALSALAHEAEDWSEAASVLVERIEVTEEHERPALLEELAVLQRDRLGDLAAAAETLEVLVRLVPGDAGRLAMLSGVYEAAGEHERLAGTLRRLVEALEGSERAAALRQLADVELVRLDRPAEARAHLEAALGLEREGPGALAACKALADVAERLEDDGLLRDALAGVGRFEADPETTRWTHLRLARLELRAGNPAAALAALEEVLAERPADPEALDLAVDLFEGEGRHADAAARLEAAVPVVEGEDPGRAAGVLARLAALRERWLEDPEAARAAWRRSLELNPARPEAFEEYRRLAAEAGAHREFYELVSAVAERVEDAPLRHAFWREGALVATTKLDDPSAAALLYERVLAEAPGDPGAVEALRRLYRRLGRWRDLAALLEEAAGSEASGQDPGECWRELARVARDRLGDLPRAARALEAALAGDAGADDAAWDDLAGVYGSLDDAESLVRVHERRAERAEDPAERALCLARAAEVYEAKLLDCGAAARSLREALAATPGAADLLLALARVQRAAGDFAAASATLEEAARAVEERGDPRQASDLQLERALLLSERMGDPTAAEEAFAQALATDPSNARAHRARVELLEAQERWEPLETALREAFAQAKEPGARAEFALRRARLLAERLGRLDDALAALDEAEEACPRLASVRDARVGILRTARRAGPLAEALAARRAADPHELTGAERCALLREEAELRAFQLGDPERALALLREALELRPKDRAVLRALLRVERRLGLGRPLAEHLEAAARLERDPRRRAAYLVEAGRVLKTRAGDASAAKLLLARALKADPSLQVAVRWLAAIAREEGDEEELARLLGREAELEEDPIRRAELRARRGRLLAARDPEAAREVFGRALEDHPDSLEAWRGLAPLLRKAEAWEELAHALSELARLERDPRLRLRELALLGELRLSALRDPGGAREAFEKALEIDPRDPRALRGRTRSLEGTGEAAALAESLRAEFEAAAAADERVALGRRLATLLLEACGDAAGATDILEEVLRLRPLDEEAWRLLRDIHVSHGNFAALADAYEREARTHPEVRRQEECFRAAAQIVQHHLGDARRAAELYGEVLRRGDPHALAIVVLPPLLLEVGDEAAYERCLQRIPEIVPGTRAAADAYVALGSRAVERGELELARRRFEAALAEQPESVRALDRLAEVHRRRKEFSQLVEVLRRKRALLGVRREALDLHLQVARHLQVELHDEQGAVDELLAAEALARRLEAKEREDILVKLRTLCRRCARHEELSQVLGALAGLREGAAAAELLVERAVLERDERSDPRAAIAAYAAAFAQHETLDSLDPRIELLAAEELWEELVHALEERARLVPEPVEAAAALARAASVLDERLGRPEDALRVFERVLDLAPDRLDAYERLDALCLRTGDRGAHARAIEREVAVLEDAAREDAGARGRLVHRALQGADLLEALHESERACALLERARSVAPKDRRVFERLEGFYREGGRPADRYQVLRGRAEALEDPAELARLHEDLARLAGDELGDRAAARGHWEQVLALAPGHPEAFAALRAAYDATGDDEALARLLEGEFRRLQARRAAGEAVDADALAELCLELGEVLEARLGRLDEAAAAFAEAVALLRGDARPLRGLERVHRARGDWRELVRVRQALRDQEADPARRAELALGVADAHEELGERDRAIVALQEALEELPDEVAILARLRAYLVEGERWEEAVGVLAREADAVPERSAEFERRMERAQILRDRLKRPGEAAEEFERARGLAPQELAPLVALADLYAAAGRTAPLVEVLEARAVLESDDAEAAALHARAGALLSAAEPRQAASCYERALRRDPLRGEDLEVLADLYERVEDWAARARALHRRAELARALEEDPAVWWKRAAEVEETRLEAPALAAATWERVVGCAPEDDTALAELARLRGVLGQHAAREQLLGRRAALAKGSARRELLLERARVLEAELGRPAAAAACVRAALDELVEEEGRDAAEARRLAGELMRLCEDAEDPAGVADACEHALAHARDEEDRLALLRRLAALTTGPVYRPARAIEVSEELYARVPAEAAGPLEALYRREGRSEALAEFLQREARRLLEAGAPPTEVASLTLREAELHRTVLGQPEVAVGRYRELLASDPGLEAARDGLEAIFRQGGDRERLAELLAERAERASDPGSAAQLHGERAVVLEELGRVGDALAALEVAMERASEAPTASRLRGRLLRSLARLYRREGRFEELAKALRALAEEPHLEAAERSDSLFELGLVLRRDLGRPDEAAAAFEAALEAEAGNVPAARALAALCEAREDWARLVEVYELEVRARVDRGRRVWLECQVGALRSRLGDRPAARDAYRRALELAPETLEAWVGLAAVARELGEADLLATALEALSERAPSPVDRGEALRELARLCDGPLEDRARAVACWRRVLQEAPDDVDALRGLAAGLRALGDKAALTDCVEQELRVCGDAERRRLLSLEACRLREDLAEAAPKERTAHLERALAHAAVACEVAGNEAEGLAAYSRVAEKLGRWKELADATCRMARAVDDTSRCAWMLRRAAKIRSLRLGDARGAAEAYLEAVRAVPGDSESWEALEGLARELGDDELLLRALRRLLQLAEGPARKAEVALRLGIQLLRARQLSAAIDALVVARELGRGKQRARALEQLEVAYRAAERWSELVAVLGERARRAPAAAELLQEQAKLYEERLGRRDAAIEVLASIRKEDPENAQVTRELERLLLAEQRWTDLVELYEQEARRLGRGGYDALVRLGEVARDRLDDPELAADALQRAVTLNPSGREAREGLKELYARSERYPELLDTLRLEIGLVKEPRRRVRLLRQAGTLAEERLGDLVTAERFFREAASLSPNDLGLLEALARVQEARAEYLGLVETLQRRLSLEQRPAERLELFKKTGRVLAGRLQRPFEAIAAYRKALELDPGDAESQVALTDLLRSQGEWEDLAQILSHRLQAVEGPERVALELELALVSAHELDQPRQALAAAERALARDPNCVEAVRLQVEVGRTWGRERGQFQELAVALERLAERTSEAGSRAELYVELGDVLREDLGDRRGALEAYRKALAADPAKEDAFEHLEPLLREAEAYPELVASAERAAAASEGFRRGELLAKAAEVLEKRLGDPERAEARYREALVHAPSHLPALRGLARLLGAKGAGSPRAPRAQAEELVRVLLALAKAEDEPAAEARAFVRAGDVYRDALGMYPQGRRCYELALERNPQDVETLAALAEMAWAADDRRAALRHLATLASDPQRLGDAERAAELLWARGQCLEGAGRAQEAAASYRQALELRPGHLQALEDLGRLLLAAGQWEVARPVVEELVRRTRPPKVRASHTLALARALRELGERSEAVRCYRQALDVLPERYDAHLALAELLEQDDPDGARRHYEQVVAHRGEDDPWASVEQRVQARTALARLFEVVYRDPDTAARHLQAAVDLPGPHQAKTSRRLAEIHGRAGRWAEAVHNLKRAIEQELDRKTLAELHASLARVLRDRLGQPALARRCFEKSLEFDPADRKTLESLLRLLESSGDLDAQARVLELAARQAREGRTGDEAALRMRRAEVLLRQKKLQLAAREFDRVLALEPTHSGARAQLARLTLELGDVRGAERIHRTLLADDPLLVGSYQALARAWRLGGRAGAHEQAVRVLVALRAVSDAEDREVARRLRPQAPTPRARLKEDEFAASLAHEGLRGAPLEFLRKAGPQLLRLVPDDLKKHGIGWRTPRHGIEGDAFPEHGLLKRVCELLGLEELDVYWMPGWKHPEPVIGHAKGRPALILCPEVFAGLEEDEKAFVLGRALGPLRLNLQLLFAFPEADLRLLFLGALRGFDPAQRHFVGEDEKLARNAAKQIGRASELHSGLRNTQLGLWQRQEELDFGRLAQAARRTGSRAGLLAAGGMDAALRAIAATNLSLRGRIPATTQGVIGVFREFPELVDLTAYAVSEGYLRLRERCLRS
ncbi:MAG: hypothetical protein D6731_03970 [Planctomycetota bacterium]|nr:MAG: hypothetical protein D6731_03970 [Planctomycetota bacterium]